MHLNDVHCGIDDTIGYDGFVLYRDEIKNQYNYVLTVDVGDHIQVGTIGAISLVKQLSKSWNKLISM